MSFSMLLFAMLQLSKVLNQYEVCPTNLKLHHLFIQYIWYFNINQIIRITMTYRIKQRLLFLP